MCFVNKYGNSINKKPDIQIIAADAGAVEYRRLRPDHR